MEDKMPRVGTAILVINNKGNVLLSKRLNGEDTGVWCPPGGKLDFGENIKACMYREVLEETDLKLRNVHVLPLVTKNMTNHGNHYICFWGYARVETDDDFVDFIEYKDGKPKSDGIWHFLDPKRMLEQHKKDKILFGSAPEALGYYLQMKDKILSESLNFFCWA